MMKRKRTVLLVTAVLSVSTPLLSGPGTSNSNCQGLPTGAQLIAFLQAAPGVVAAPIGGPVGGLFGGTLMWGAIVNRDGEICAFETSTVDPTQVWPGSQAIAKAKAYTANAFSNDTVPLPLSTARLYTFTQPGHSLWSLGASNLFNPQFLAPPGGQGGGGQQIAGGMIFFGGGVSPLRRLGKYRWGPGVSAVIRPAPIMRLPKE